jgi:DNA (cytosine-5)-methyltransferase 1
MKYFSMFTGIGGFELGIEQAYSRVERDRQEDNSLSGRQEVVNGSGVGNQQAQRPSDELDQRQATCVGYSEIDKYADATYKSHFGGHINYGDATKINAGELPDFDLLVGGFPCQAFSVAGKRAGFNDTRGTLFFDIARILKEKQPRHLVLENVKGLLSHDQGRTFQTIIGVLTDLGYFVEWQVLNSKDFGVPQNRERVFIVGHLGGEPRRKVFPIRQSQNRNTQEIQRTIIRGRDKNTIGCLDTRGVNAFDRADLDKLIYEQRIRRLTPVECERLQGFPDNWTVGSDTQRYKQCGNAVTVNVVEAVMNKFNDKYKED